MLLWPDQCNLNKDSAYLSDVSGNIVNNIPTSLPINKAGLLHLLGLFTAFARDKAAGLDCVICWWKTVADNRFSWGSPFPSTKPMLVEGRRFALYTVFIGASQVERLFVHMGRAAMNKMSVN